MALTFSADGELAVRPVNIGFHFTLLVGLETLGDFQAIEGISFSSPIKKYNEGGRNHSAHLLRWDGPGERGEVTLRWGMMTRAALYQWASAVERGYIFRKPVYILQLDRDKVPLRLICLFSAFPVRWSMGSLDANSNNWSVEEVVLAYEDIAMLALNESAIDALGGLVGNFFNSGTKISWETDSAIDWETSEYSAQQLDAYEELSEWEEDQQNLEYLLRNWDNMSEADRIAFMESSGLTKADLLLYVGTNAEGDTDDKIQAILDAYEGVDGEPDSETSPTLSEALTDSGTTLAEVEAAIGDTTAPISSFVEVNTGGVSESSSAHATFDPTTGTIGSSEEDEEDAAEADDAVVVPRAFATNSGGGTSLFDVEDGLEEGSVPSGFAESGTGGVSLEDAESALSEDPLSGFDEENLGGMSLADMESELGDDALSGFDEENAGGTSLEDAEAAAGDSGAAAGDPDEDTGA